MRSLLHFAADPVQPFARGPRADPFDELAADAPDGTVPHSSLVRWNGVAVRPYVGIDNLFAERYNASTIFNATGNRFFEPAPGRQFIFKLTASRSF